MSPLHHSFAPTSSFGAGEHSALGPTSVPFPRSFQFGPFLFQPERQLLLKLRAPVRIGGRALDLLTLLVERAGEVVSKQDLIAAAWPETFVDEANLKVNIASLRRALGESFASPAYIATVVGRGYRFIAPVVRAPFFSLPREPNEMPSTSV